MSAASLSTLRLLHLLVRFRLRHTWNGFRRGGTSGSRWVSLLAFILPVTYVGLFVSAFGVVAEMGSWPVQVATLAVVVWGLACASLVSKLTGGDAVVAGTGENEFFMARPVGLAKLVVARALASAVLDFWGALFLLPVLAAVSYVWRLGVLGFALALLISVTTQVALVALGQCVGLGLLARVSLAKRRTLATAFGLVSAASVATLWAIASFVLRQPGRFVLAVEPYAQGIAHNPLAVLVWPLVALRERGAVMATAWACVLVAVAAVVVGLAARVASVAARRGWQDVGLPFETAMAASKQRRGPALSIAGKELRLLVRDRARFVSLLAMPFLFVGVQVFGAAGMEVFGGGPRRAGLLAYSLAAYLATLGPLPHMQSERRAFWILRSVPVPLGRIMWGKVKAWLWLVVGVGGLSFVATVVVAGDVHLADPLLWQTLALVVTGSALVCALAVGVGCNAADLSDDGRNALQPGSVYVFLLVAGLFNVALLREGALVWRTLALYGASVGLVWTTGVTRVQTALDPGRLRPLTPGDGALASVLLFCGFHLLALAPGGMSTRESMVGRAVWAAVVAIGCMAFLWTVRRGLARKGAAVPPVFAAWRQRGWIRVAGAVVFCVGGCALLRLTLQPVPSALVIVVAEEVVFRSLLQRSLHAHFVHLRFGGAAAVGVTVLVASVATIEPLSAAAVMTQAVAAMAFAASRSVVPSVIGRMVMFLI